MYVGIRVICVNWQSVSSLKESPILIENIFWYRHVHGIEVNFLNICLVRANELKKMYTYDVFMRIVQWELTRYNYAFPV